VIHGRQFPACQNKCYSYSVDCLQNLKFQYLQNALPLCPIHTPKYFLCFLLLELYSLFLYATLKHNISLKLSGFDDLSIREYFSTFRRNLRPVCLGYKPSHKERRLIAYNFNMEAESTSKTSVTIKQLKLSYNPKDPETSSHFRRIRIIAKSNY